MHGVKHGEEQDAAEAPENNPFDNQPKAKPAIGLYCSVSCRVLDVILQGIRRCGRHAGDTGEDGGTDGGMPDASLFTLPSYETGAVELDDAGCPPLPAQPDLFDAVLALADAGLTRSNIVYPSYWHTLFTLPDVGCGIVYKFVLPYFNLLHDHPLLVPSFASNLKRRISIRRPSRPIRSPRVWRRWRRARG